MFKKCCVDKCIKNVTSICNCSDPETYICSMHIGKHTKSKVIHYVKNIMISLDEDQTGEFLIKAKNLMKNLKESRKKIQAN